MNGQFPNPSNPKQQKYKFGFFLPNHNLRRLRHLKERDQRTHSQTEKHTSNLNLGLAGRSESHFNSCNHDILPEDIWTDEDLKSHKPLCKGNRIPISANIDECLPPLAGVGTGGKLGGFVSGSVWRHGTPWNCSKGTGNMEKCYCLDNVYLPTVNGTNEDDFNRTEASARNKNDSSEIGHLPRIKNGEKESLNSRVSDAHLGLPLLVHKDQSNSVDNLKFRLENFQPAVEMPLPIKLNNASLFNFNPISKQQGQASKCLSNLSVLPPINKLDHSQRGRQFDEIRLNLIDEETEMDVLNDNAAVGNYDRGGKISCQFPNHGSFEDHCVTFQQHHTSSKSKYVQPHVLIPTELQDHHVHSKSHDQTLSGDKMYRRSTEILAKPNDCSRYKHSVNGGKNKLEAMKNAKLVENWINILEDTELTPTPGRHHITDYFGKHSSAASESPALHGRSGEPTSHSSGSIPGPFKGPTSIDAMNFFDKPKSVLHNVDDIRSLNCHTSHVKALQRSNQLVNFEEMSSSIASKVRLKQSNVGAPALNNNHKLSSLLAIHGVNQDLIHKKNDVGGATYVLCKHPPKSVQIPERSVGQRNQRKECEEIIISSHSFLPARDEDTRPKQTNQKGKSPVQFIHPDTMLPHPSKAIPAMELTQANGYPCRSQDTSVRQLSGIVKQKDMVNYASKVLNSSCVVSGGTSGNGDQMLHSVSEDQADNHPPSAMDFGKGGIVEMNAVEGSSQCRSLPTQACMEGRYRADPAGTNMTSNASTSLKTVLMPEETTSKDEKEEDGRLSEYISHRLEAHSDSSRIFDREKGDNPALDTINSSSLIKHQKSDSLVIDTMNPSSLIELKKSDSPVMDTIFPSNVDYDKGDDHVFHTIHPDSSMLDKIYIDDPSVSPRDDTAHFEDKVHPSLRNTPKCVVRRDLQRSLTAVPNTALVGIINIKFPEEIQPNPTNSKLMNKSRDHVKNQEVQFKGTPASNREIPQFSPPSLPKYLLASTSESNFSHPSCTAEKEGVLISVELNPSFPDRIQHFTRPSTGDAFCSIDRDSQSQMEGGTQEEQKKQIDHLMMTDSYEDNHQYVGKALCNDVSGDSDKLANETEMGTQDNAIEKTAYEGMTPASEEDNTSVNHVPEMKSEKTQEPDSWRNRVGGKFNLNASALEKKTTKKEDGQSIPQFLPKTIHAEKIGLVRGEHSQENYGRRKELEKPAKFLYPKKVTATRKLKGYSTCLVEGGTTTYNRITVATEQSKLRTTHMTNPTPYLQRNRRHLQLGSKEKIEKEANVSGDTVILSAEKKRKRENIEQVVRHWMSGRKVPTGQKLHLSKQTLDDMKKVLASQCAQNPDLMEDPELLASLLPSFIDMGCIRANELSQSDEVLTAALDNCDVDVLLSNREIMMDPHFYKCVAEKMDRDIGLTDAAKSQMRNFIDNNTGILDSAKGGMVPSISPSMADIMNMVSNNLASSGYLKDTDILEVMNFLEENKSSDKFENDKIKNMVYDGLKKVRIDSACDDSSKMKKRGKMKNKKHQRQRRMEGEVECETGRNDEDQDMNPEHRMKRRERRQRKEEGDEDGDREGNDRNKRKGKRQRREHTEGEEGGDKDEGRRKRERRHERRERRRKEGDGGSKMLVEDESQIAEWRKRRRIRTKRNSSSREEQYSEDDNEREERREKRRRMNAKKKLRAKDASKIGRGSDGSFSSSISSYSSGSSSYYDSSSVSSSDDDSYYDSSNYNSSLSFSYISSTYSPSSCSSYDSEHSTTSKSYHRKRNRKEFRKKIRATAPPNIGEITGIEGEDGDSSVVINGRRQKKKISTQHGSDEQQMTFSGNTRKISEKERRRERRHHRRRRRKSGMSGSGEDNNTSSLMDEIGDVMEMVKSIKDTTGDISRQKSNLINGPQSTTQILAKEDILRASSFPSQFLDENRNAGGNMGENQSIGSVECSNVERKEVQHSRDEKKQKFEDDMAETYEREVTMQVAKRREMQAMAKNKEKTLKRALSSHARAQEEKNDDAIGRTKRLHEAAMEKFRKQAELRKAFQLYENEVIQEYNHTNDVWADMDYAYIALYLGQDYTQELKRVEVARELEAKYLCRNKTKDLEEQRNELLQMLRSTKLEFFFGPEVELSEIAELLRVSRAFVFSYFDNIFGPDEGHERS